MIAQGTDYDNHIFLRRVFSSKLTIKEYMYAGKYD
jgi:hypothetical protein